MDDLIKREDAIKAVRESKPWHFNEIIPVLSAIKGIPSAENKGEWIEGETFYFCGEQQFPMTCSVCGRSALNEPWTFCPNCGARMVK